MNTKLLVDAIVRQTTVLIAQLATAAGIRAPLADIADQVFLELSREIELHGVSRKVAADMFGLALRSYQKKVQRLTESVTERDRTLWQAVLDYLEKYGGASRPKLLSHFQRDDPLSVGAVLNDLVSSGLVYKTGSGGSVLYGLTREQDFVELVKNDDQESTASLVWLVIYRNSGITRKLLAERLSLGDSQLDIALAHLEAQKSIQKTTAEGEPSFSAATFVVPVGASQGWEAAVFDHFQAMVTAIGTKLRLRAGRSAKNDIVGGATLSFDVHENHPYREEVQGLLARVREQANELWKRVTEYDEAHPIPDNEKIRVTFYFGQSVAPCNDIEHAD